MEFSTYLCLGNSGLRNDVQDALNVCKCISHPGTLGPATTCRRQVSMIRNDTYIITLMELCLHTSTQNLLIKLPKQANKQSTYSIPH